MKPFILFIGVMSFSFGMAQVAIDNTFFVNQGAILYLGPATTISTNGELKSEGGNITINTNLIGDDKFALDANSNVILENGTLTFSNELDEEMNNLTISTTATVEVLAGNTLALNGSLENNNTAAGLKLLADATDNYSMVLVEGNQTGAGQVLAELYVTGGSGWKYIGSSVNTNFLDLKVGAHSLVAAAYPQGNLFYWDANTAQWAFPNTVNANFEQGRGYNVFMGNSSGGTYVTNLPGKIDLQGTLLSNGDVTKTLVYNNGQGSTENFAGGTTLTYTQGWNMLANPYPCAYDLTNQARPTGTSNAYYIWNTNGGASGQFAQYVNNVGVNGGVPYLAPFQAFFIQTASATPGDFTFKANQRVVSQKPPHFKTNTINNNMRLSVFSLSDKTNSDENYLEFEESATNAFDLDWDAREMENGNGVPNLYYAVDGDEFAINRMAIFRDSKTIPVHFKCDESGRFEIDSELFGMDYSWSIELEDLQTGFMHDLRKGSVRFEHSTENLENRFLLHINGGEDEYFTSKSRRVKIYGHQNNVMVKVRGQEMAVKEVSVYDMSGRLLTQTEMEPMQTKLTLPVSLRDKGVFMVVFKSAHFTVAEKVILQN